MAVRPDRVATERSGTSGRTPTAGTRWQQHLGTVRTRWRSGLFPVHVTPVETDRGISSGTAGSTATVRRGEEVVDMTLDIAHVRGDVAGSDQRTEIHHRPLAR
jgi:hypothetical protein